MILEGITAKLTFEQKTCRKGEVEPRGNLGCVLQSPKTQEGKPRGKVLWV